ncbi:relaxase/mobilization nuclease domain-containing protein [Phocaeicola vulgatus]|uniref:relaxase/mobilization nuclease domain-containing protein n=1 Tax=Phocaeicola vulgatus TaxID=821 RepID=UPI003567B6F5
MIAKARAISHGANSMRYVVNKDKADIIKLHLLPDNVAAESLWSRMLLHQAKFFGKHSKTIKNNMIRIEVSPTAEETKEWTNADWEKLTDDFIREFDSIDLSEKTKRAKDKHTNLRNSQYVVSLHRDSKSGILHLHIDANRIDNDGNINNDHNIHIRAMAAANNIAKRRGWIQASDISMQNKQEITNACMDALRSMDRFDWNDYVERLKQYGYDVMQQKDSQNIVRGYSIKRGNSTYKSSSLGKGRNLMPSKIEATWKELHKEVLQKENADIDNHEKNTSEELQTAKNARCRNCNEFQSQSLVHHSINWNYCDYEIDILSNVNDILMQDVSLPENNVFATINDLQRTAVLLFAGYLDAATQMSESTGGGGSTPDGWGRDKDEDDLEWARRCAKMASHMCRPAIKRGNRR